MYFFGFKKDTFSMIVMSHFKVPRGVSFSMYTTEFLDVALEAFLTFTIFLDRYFIILMNREYNFSYPESILYFYGIS